LLFIPESRKRPITESLLYKQIIRFFRDEGIEGYFDIVFISIADVVVEAKKSDEWDYRQSKVNLPPKNFRSGRAWVSKKVKQGISEHIADYLYKNSNKYHAIIAYARGSYLEAVRMAARKTGMDIKEIFSDDELTQLKKKGIMWMKVGLRMPVAFIIFRMKIRHMVMEHSQNKQLKLF
jgi:hypothetical protein